MFIADPLPITIRSYSFIRVDATSKQISVWRLALGSPIDWDGRAIAHSYEETRQALLGRRRMEEPLNLALNLMGTDRKSTRLNSSHGYISYAVFCLKKKTTHADPHA